jgi:hypothetical protein
MILRLALFYLLSILAGGFSNILAYGLSQMSGVGGLQGWRWIFVSLSAISLPTGAVLTGRKDHRRSPHAAHRDSGLVPYHRLPRQSTSEEQLHLSKRRRDHQGENQQRPRRCYPRPAADMGHSAKSLLGLEAICIVRFLA